MIAQQSDQLEQAAEEIEKLKRELEVAELRQFADPKVMENERRALLAFYTFSERLAGALHTLEQGVKDLETLDLKRKQAIESGQLIDALDRIVNRLRVNLYNRSSVRQTPAENKKETTGKNDARGTGEKDAKKAASGH